VEGGEVRGAVRLGPYNGQREGRKSGMRVGVRRLIHVGAVFFLTASRGGVLVLRNERTSIREFPADRRGCGSSDFPGSPDLSGARAI